MSCADGDGINLCPPTSRPWNRSPSEPVMLSMVCSSWRKTAISTPQLWSVVRLENSTQLNSEVAAERLGQMTEVFMTRARTSPLTIRISDFWGPGISKMYPTGVDRALEALCQRSLQWVDVDFTQCSPSFCGVPAFRNIKGSFPNLRKIAIEADGLLGFKKFGVIFDGSQCPVLKEVELAGVRDRQDQLLRTFSWEGIEHFKIWHSSALDGGPSPLVFVSMCPELKSLDFSLYFGGASSSEVRPLTSNIESLILQIIHTPWADTTWVPFLDRVTLPRLSELMIIKYLSDKRIGDISPLLQCISRSLCIITSLSIGSSNLSKQQNYDLLSHIPGLTFLSIYDDDPDRLSAYVQSGNPMKDFLDLLLIDRTSTTGTQTRDPAPRLLPRLRTLSAEPVGTSEQDVDTLQRAVASRWTPDAAEAARIGVDCLRRAWITFRRKSRFDASSAHPLPELKLLNALKEEGLKVSFR
ncbi:hypothetical protein AAF712_011138 [Marasmius tenuissimus]|uniref:F-box domain-containing protein n=1 Tax=Marasmius tenuissimus TaxID=585030 RepID=A0ABR2ZMN8_9AGAR